MAYLAMMFCNLSAIENIVWKFSNKYSVDLFHWRRIFSIVESSFVLMYFCLKNILLAMRNLFDFMSKNKLPHQHLFAVDDVYSRLGNFAQFAAAEVKNIFALCSLLFHIINCCCLLGGKVEVGIVLRVLLP